MIKFPVTSSYTKDKSPNTSQRLQFCESLLLNVGNYTMKAAIFIAFALVASLDAAALFKRDISNNGACSASDGVCTSGNCCAY